MTCLAAGAADFNSSPPLPTRPCRPYIQLACHVVGVVTNDAGCVRDLLEDGALRVGALDEEALQVQVLEPEQEGASGGQAVTARAAGLLVVTLEGAGQIVVEDEAQVLAICAMILPGISGSFILLLIGMYPVVIEAISAFNMPLLAVFLLGCCTGLLVFSRFLSWLLQRYHGPTIAVLTGFLLGSLLIVWPWKEALEVIVNSKGHEVVLTHRLVMPAEYGAVTGIDPQTTQALLLMMLGAVLVLGLEYLGGRSARATGTQPQQRL